MKDFDELESINEKLAFVLKKVEEVKKNKGKYIQTFKRKCSNKNCDDEYLHGEFVFRAKTFVRLNHENKQISENIITRDLLPHAILNECFKEFAYILDEFLHELIHSSDSKTNDKIVKILKVLRDLS